MKLVLRQLSYTYPGADKPSVSGADLSLAAGKIVLLTGPTGCGKSTLLRAAAGLAGRHGQGVLSGEILLCGTDPADMAPAERVRRLGFVAQEPQDQLVASTVGDELAFAMESARQDPQAIAARLPELLAQVGLEVELERATLALSGGQTQRLVCGAALAAGAQVLLLDEPLAQLDPLGAQTLMRRLREVADQGLAVLIVEHRLEATLPYVDRVVLMENGHIHSQGLTQGGALNAAQHHAALRMGLSVPGQTPSVFAQAQPVGDLVLDPGTLQHRYWGAENDALVPTSLVLHAGERVALLGPNGAGKSTLLGLLTGQLGPERPGVVGVPQDPDLCLFCSTVANEVAYGPVDQRMPDAERRTQLAMQALSVADLAHRAPHALSRGQRLRVAVAAALSCAPQVLVLDEPTSGQDHEQVEQMMHALREALKNGALVFATHDVDLALRHATRVMLLEHGSVVAQGSPAELAERLLAMKGGA